MGDPLPEDDLACRTFVEIVTDYLEGALPADEARRLEAHLAECPGCDVYLDQVRETIARVGEVPRDELSQAARGALRDAFRSWSAER